MSNIDSLYTTGVKFFGVEISAPSTDTIVSLDFLNNLYGLDVDPDTNANLRGSPSWFALVGVATVGTAGSVDVSLEYADVDSDGNITGWNQILSDDLSIEDLQIDAGDSNKLKRIEGTGDSYTLNVTTQDAQVRMYERCAFRVYRVKLTSSADFAGTAKLGVTVNTFCERYTGFDTLV